MKRFARRILGVVAGLALGWYAAGVVSMATTNVADDEHGAEKTSQVHHAAHDSGHNASVQGDDHHGANPATALAPHRQPIPLLGPVLIAAAFLFVAAVVLGIPVMKLKGPEPPDPAAGGH